MGKPFDPENKYSLPYVYGLTGIGVNATDIEPSTISSWGDLWRDEYKGKLLLMNDPREVFHIALLLDGKSPNSENEAEIKAAYERLQKSFRTCSYLTLIRQKCLIYKVKFLWVCNGLAQHIVRKAKTQI